MTRRLIPASCYESLVLSEAAVGGVRWDNDPRPSVCQGCLTDLDWFATFGGPGWYMPSATHGRPATVAEVVRALGERGR